MSILLLSLLLLLLVGIGVLMGRRVVALERFQDTPTAAPATAPAPTNTIKQMTGTVNVDALARDVAVQDAVVNGGKPANNVVPHGFNPMPGPVIPPAPPTPMPGPVIPPAPPTPMPGPVIPPAPTPLGPGGEHHHRHTHPLGPGGEPIPHHHRHSHPLGPGGEHHHRHLHPLGPGGEPPYLPPNPYNPAPNPDPSPPTPAPNPNPYPPTPAPNPNPYQPNPPAPGPGSNCGWCPACPDMSQYIRMDEIPCWNCTLP